MDDKIKIPDKLPKEITDKYQVESNTFKQEVKDNPKDRIEVEIGDSKQEDFKPQVKIMRWDNEVNFSMRALEDPNAVVEIDKEVIKYITPDYEVHQYDKPDASEDGGFEFEWILPKKPASNVLEATIQTKGLNFFYQPALTQEEIDEGMERPENVVGSYAVYHATKGGMNRSDGMEYKVGKAFHIYRPKCIDANGIETWGELNIDTDNGLLTVTVDQDFLDNAVYPVIVDPTFGYTGNGASQGNIATSTNTSIMAGYKSAQTANVESGTLNSISASLSSSTGSPSIDIALAIYRFESGGADIHDLVAMVESLNLGVTTTKTFYTINASSESLTQDDYLFAALGNGEDLSTGSVRCSLDASGGTSIYSESTAAAGSYATRKAENPWTETDFSSSSQYSIYATYTTSDSPTGATLCTFRPYNNVPPTTNYATLDTRNSHPVLDFDTTTQETAIFEGIMPRSYSGGDITVYIHFSAETGVAGSGAWGISFERIGDGSQDIDSDGFATEILTGGFPVSATSGHVMIASTTLTNAECDATVAGEKFRLRIRRSVATDEVAGDLELHGIELRETA